MLIYDVFILLMLHLIQEARDDLRQSMAADAFTLQCESISDPKRENGLSVSSTESTEGSANFQRKIGSLRFMDSSPEVRVVGPPNKEASSDIVSPVLSGNKHSYTIVPKISSRHSNNIPSFQ